MEKRAVAIVLMLLFGAIVISGYRAYEYIMKYDQRRQGALACAVLIALALALYNFFMWLVHKGTKA